MLELSICTSCLLLDWSAGQLFSCVFIYCNVLVHYTSRIWMIGSVMPVGGVYPSSLGLSKFCVFGFLHREKNSMKSSLSWKANSSSACQISCLLYNLKVRYHIHKILLQVSFVSQVYPFDILKDPFWYYPYLCWRLHVGIHRLGFQTKTLCVCPQIINLIITIIVYVCEQHSDLLVNLWKKTSEDSQ